MKIFALLMAASVASITLSASLGYADQIFGFLRFIPGGDLTGHFGLFGLLGFAVVAAGSRSTQAATRSLRFRIAVAVAVFASLEEMSQVFVPARTFSLLDLSASLAGVALGSFTAMKWEGRRVADDDQSPPPSG